MTESGVAVTIAQVRTDLVSNLPFLGNHCNINRLIASVVATRYWRAKNMPSTNLFPASEIAHWMKPTSACDLSNGVPEHLEPVTPHQHQMIEEAISSAIVTRPEWAAYFGLPIRYLQLPADSTAISASAPHWPQHIMLSPAAFTSEAELREQVVHEFCHQWMYLLEEVCPLEKATSSRDLVLPSGTSERSPREVLGAAHVGIALIDLYSAETESRTHVDALHSYTRGCLDVADSVETLLTTEGVQLARRMRRRLQK